MTTVSSWLAWIVGTVAPKAIWYLSILLLAININSFPILWHIRFWWRLIPFYIGILAQGRAGYIKSWERAMRKRGGIGASARIRRRAFPDDCDFNMHLSNSCYAKSADHALSAWSFDTLSPFLMAGAYQALGASHSTFIREIPIGTEYFMESHVAGWGDKWSYLVTEFIIYPKKASGGSKGGARQQEKSFAETTEKGPLTAVQSGAATPAEMKIPGLETISSGAASPTENVSMSGPVDVASVAAAQLRNPKSRTDGGVVVAYVVHELCFKIGRITIPPRIAFHICGHSNSLEEQERARAITRSKRDSVKWLAGGWRKAEDANSIGIDIAPSTFVAQDQGNGSSWASRIVSGMQGVNAGLGEAVNL